MQLIKNVLNAVLVSAECSQHFAGRYVHFVLNSTTSNVIQERSHSKSKLAGTRRKKESLKNEMLEQELQVEITRNHSSSFDNITPCAHHFAGEVL